MRYFLYVPLIIGLALSSCESTGSNDMKRPAGGDADELIIVVDSMVWDGPVGTVLRRTFAAPMAGMPQDEPLFNIYKVNPLKVNSVLESAYNMIYVTTLDSKTSQSKKLRSMFTDESLKRIDKDTTFFRFVEDDKYAKGQKVMHLFAKSEQILANHIAANRAELLALFEGQASKITSARIFRSRSVEIENALKEKYGFDIKVPFGWDLAKDLPNFAWVRELGQGKEKNIFVYSEPYTSQEVFNDIPALRDRITEMYLRDGQKPHLYIQRQEIIPVQVQRVNFNGKFAMQARGLWAVSDMSSGGPFLSYTLVDEKNQMLYYIEGYVFHAAGKKKRMMREMDAILSSFKVPSETK